MRADHGRERIKPIKQLDLFSVGRFLHSTMGVCSNIEQGAFRVISKRNAPCL